MKTFLFLLCLWLANQGSSALDWKLSVKKSGSTIYACSNDTVTFPYLYNLSESESIVSMTWNYHGNGVTKSIGTFFLNDFMTTRHYFNKVTLNKNGNFTMQNVNIKDNGNYILKIQTQNKDQSKQIYTKELSLVVSKNLMYKKSNMVAKFSNKAEWNSVTDSFSLSLTCGDFIFKNDNAPIDVQWITPDGSVKNSTKYTDGKFYLQLDNPVEGGQYVCRIPKASISTVCAASNDNTQVAVDVDEDKARIILLENQNQKQDMKIKTMGEKIKNQDEKLKAQKERIKEQKKRLQEQKETFNGKIDNLVTSLMSASGCEDWNSFKSGKRMIYLANSKSIQLYCDQDTDGGKWNVFQIRRDGRVDFYRGWSDYRNGFGDPDKEFWLGLETVHQMTSDGRKYELRFDLEKQDGSKYYAVYDDFSIGSESEGYAVHFTGYSGDAGNSFTEHEDMKFSTKDQDQDTWWGNCAVDRMGAWWYKSCHDANLNGHYNDKRNAKGLNWFKLTGYKTSLKKTEMKFRVKQ